MEEQEAGVDVPFDLLAPDTLEELIKSFVLREGTDYGAQEASLQRKLDDIRRQLKNGKLKIVFDLASDTGSIVPTGK